jgi:hypothetical protein
VGAHTDALWRNGSTYPNLISVSLNAYYNNGTKRKVNLNIYLTALTNYLRIISIFIYPEGLLPPNISECDGTSAPTSLVYASSKVIEMIAEYNKLWRYATLQWHDVFTKYREFP